LSARARSRRLLARPILAAAFALLTACGGGGLEGHLRSGEDYLEKGRWEEARLEGIYVLREDPGNSEALWIVGRSLMHLDRDGEAKGYLRSLVKADGSYRIKAAELYDSFARKDFEARRLGRAAERWQSALEFESELNLGAHDFFVGNHFFRMQDYEQSARLFARAEEAFPDSSAVLETLFPHAQSLARLGRWEEAGEQLERFLRQAPQHPRRLEAIYLYQDVMLRLARADRELLDFGKALEKLDGVLRYRANPGMIEAALLEKGRCLEELGRYREAAESYRRLIDENSSGTGRAVEAAMERLETLEKARLK